MADRGANDERNAHLRALPGVDRVLAALGQSSNSLVTGAARRAVDLARQSIRAGGTPPSLEEIVESTKALVEQEADKLLQPVINATGVLIHTNLGRVPLGPAQLEAVTESAGGYSNLELDLGAGERGSRYAHARTLLRAVTGAEDALVVNNCAASVLLLLATLSREREVIISRGELIEIGGEFRIPDIIEVSGARLVEVGTTNRTHHSDYERAVTPATAAILKVHPSNYRVVGFTASVAARDLAKLARSRGVLFIHDLGSGLVETQTTGPFAASDAWSREPTVQGALGEGADLVTFSGDKLLGGPQAGIVAGRADLIAKLSGSPLLRALRVDKMTLAALQATLQAHLDGRLEDVPLWRMALAAAEELERRARQLAARLTRAVSETGVKVDVTACSSVIGGGAVPGGALESWAVTIVHPERSADELARALRQAVPPVIARIADDRVVLDVRTVAPSDDERLADLLALALS